MSSTWITELPLNSYFNPRNTQIYTWLFFTEASNYISGHSRDGWIQSIFIGVLLKSHCNLQYRRSSIGIKLLDFLEVTLPTLTLGKIFLGVEVVLSHFPTAESNLTVGALS